jgi:rhodanese-related sulfurtransferase
MAKNHSPEFVALVDAAKRNIQEITVDEVLARQRSGQLLRLVDVREDGEWTASHAVGAEHLGRGVIERDIVARVPDKAAPLVLYCGGGFRSALAAESLQKMGYTNVRSMAGGWSEWLARGGPTEQ